VTLDQLNGLSDAELLAVLEQCGGAVWAREVAARRPFSDAQTLAAASDAAWATLDEADWLQAFEDAVVQIPAAGDDGTHEAARTALQLYRDRFHRAFVTAADCHAADELLMRVRIRLGLDEGAEWRASCEERRRLARKRLERIMSAAT
jgi:hypothetical protein